MSKIKTNKQKMRLKLCTLIFEDYKQKIHLLYPIAFCLFYLVLITRPCSTWNLGQVSTSDANKTHLRRISFTLRSRFHLHRPD